MSFSLRVRSNIPIQTPGTAVCARSAWAPRTIGNLREAIHDQNTVQAMLEDYRAGLGVDREHEETDRRAGRTVRCPTLFLWSTHDDMEDLYGDPLAVWRAWAPDFARPTDPVGTPRCRRES